MHDVLQHNKHPPLKKATLSKQALNGTLKWLAAFCVLECVYAVAPFKAPEADALKMDSAPMGGSVTLSPKNCDALTDKKTCKKKDRKKVEKACGKKNKKNKCTQLCDGSKLSAKCKEACCGLPSPPPPPSPSPPPPKPPTPPADAASKPAIAGAAATLAKPAAAVSAAVANANASMRGLVRGREEQVVD